MKSFVRFLYSEFVYSFSFGKYKYLVFYTLIGLLSCLISYQGNDLNGNSVDTFYTLMKDNGYLFQLSDYQPPIYWLFIQFSTLFLMGDYLFHDVEANRSYFLLRFQSKSQYILSKVCWIIIQSTLMYGLLFLVVFVTSSLVYHDYSLGTSTHYEVFLRTQMEEPISSEGLIVTIFLGYIITTIVLTILQLLLIQFFAPLLSFLLVAVLSVLSTFIDSRWLPAIHSMILKRFVFDVS